MQFVNKNHNIDRVTIYPRNRGSRFETPADLFPETSITMLLAIQGKDNRAAEGALEEFAGRYSVPLVIYVVGLGEGKDDARDLVQSYFLDVLMKREALEKLDLKSWRLRTFLRVSISRYVRSEHRKTNRQKRGGQLRQAVFEESTVQDSTKVVYQFEREWAEAILNRVYADLRHRFRTPGRELLYDKLVVKITSRSERASLMEIAEELKLNIELVKAQLKRMRQAFRKSVKLEVGKTVADPLETEGEIKYLAAILTSVGLT